MVDLPNNSTTTAEFEGGPHLLATFSGELESFGDKDWIKLRLQPSITYQFFGSVGSAGAGAGDSDMTLFNASGAIIVTNNDDPAGGSNSYFTYTPNFFETVFVEIGSFGGAAGNYAIAVTSGATRSRLTPGPDNFSGVGNELIVGDKGDDVIDLTGAGPLHGFGEQGDDTITGDANHNRISGGLGNDTLVGGRRSRRDVRRRRQRFAVGGK